MVKRITVTAFKRHTNGPRLDAFYAVRFLLAGESAEFLAVRPIARFEGECYVVNLADERRSPRGRAFEEAIDSAIKLYLAGGNPIGQTFRGGSR